MAKESVTNFELTPKATEGLAHSAPGPSASANTISSPMVYCMVAILLPLLMVPAFLMLGRSNYFLHHGASIWVQSNDAVFAMKDRDCQVLIYGDSTAMTGIDPALVEKDTGLKTCNIAVTNAVLSVTDNLTLDRYLAQNGRPKVLLVQLSPDGFQPESRTWRSSIYAEGMLEMMRHGTAAEQRRMLLEHPQESVAFAGYAAGYSAFYALKHAAYAATSLDADSEDVTVHNGFFTPPAPARTQCDEATPASRDVSAIFPKQLAGQYHSTYASHSDVVLVNVAPIPSCDQNLGRFQQQLAGVTNNTLTALPIGYFNDGRHYTASGSEVVSRLISDEVNHATGQSEEAMQQRRSAQAVAALRAAGVLQRAGAMRTSTRSMKIDR